MGTFILYCNKAFKQNLDESNRLHANLTQEQLLRETRKINCKFNRIVDDAWKTLPIQPRIEQARTSLEELDIPYILTIRTALVQRGLIREARDLTLGYQAARIAADYSDN